MLPFTIQDTQQDQSSLLSKLYETTAAVCDYASSAASSAVGVACDALMSLLQFQEKPQKDLEAAPFEIVIHDGKEEVYDFFVSSGFISALINARIEDREEQIGIIDSILENVNKILEEVDPKTLGAATSSPEGLRRFCLEVIVREADPVTYVKLKKEDWKAEKDKTELKCEGQSKHTRMQEYTQILQDKSYLRREAEKLNVVKPAYFLVLPKGKNLSDLTVKSLLEGDTQFNRDFDRMDYTFIDHTGKEHIFKHDVGSKSEKLERLGKLLQKEISAGVSEETLVKMLCVAHQASTAVTTTLVISHHSRVPWSCMSGHSKEAVAIVVDLQKSTCEIDYAIDTVDLDTAVNRRDLATGKQIKRDPDVLDSTRCHIRIDFEHDNCEFSIPEPPTS